jgi:hypothetical protein
MAHSLRWVLGVCSFLIWTPMLPAFGEIPDPLKDYAQRIKSYESLFDTMQIRYSFKEKGVTSHQVDSQNGPILVNNLIVDGKRIRKESTRNTGDRAITVTDGTICKTWRHRESKPQDQGAIFPWTENAVPAIAAYAFRKHSNIDDVEYLSVDIVEDTDTHVTIRYRANAKSELIVRYERYGEYLRTLSYRPFYTKRPGEPKEELTSVYFTYPEWTEPNAERLGPKSIEQIHEKSVVYADVLEIDLNPIITDDLFDIEFSDGTWIKDRRSGDSSYRYSKNSTEN